ncbi:hypothetical protein PENTCL1PPCAC_23765, partial [Pristionchus entomophagus]
IGSLARVLHRVIFTDLSSLRLHRSMHVEGDFIIPRDRHDSRVVLVRATVTGSGEDGYQFDVHARLLEDVIALGGDLVGADDEADLQLGAELLQGGVAEDARRATRGLLILVHLGVRVAPSEVGADAQVGDVARTLDALQLSEIGEVLRDAAVHTQDARADLGAEGHAVEGVVVRLEERLAESELALLVEAVGHVDGARLVIATQQIHRVGVEDLVAEEQRDHLQTERTAIHVIAQEEVPIIALWLAVNVEHGAHVFKLAVLIAHHFDRRLQLEHRFLHHEDLPDSVRELDQLVFFEQRLALERHPLLHQAIDQTLDVGANLSLPLGPFHGSIHALLGHFHSLGRSLRWLILGHRQ